MRGEKKEGTLITVAWNVSEVTRFGSVLEGVETGLRQADSHLKTPPISQTRGLGKYGPPSQQGASLGLALG